MPNMSSDCVVPCEEVALVLFYLASFLPMNYGVLEMFRVFSVLRRTWIFVYAGDICSASPSLLEWQEELSW